MQRIKHCHTRSYHDFLAVKSPFAWGNNDCCLYAADGIKAQTGIDIADDFRGKYTDKVSAFRLIHSVTGGTTVADAAAYCANKHGLKELAYPKMAQRGDLVVFHNADGELVAGVVHLNGRHLVTVGEHGPVSVSISNVVRAWSVSGEHGHHAAFDKDAKPMSAADKIAAHQQVITNIKAHKEARSKSIE